MARPYVSYILGRSEFVVDSRYVNLRPIGRGAYGLVASAEDLVTGRKVAIKRISRVFQDLIDAKRIMRELKMLRHFGQHENIIEIYDIMTTPPHTEDFHTLYIVTQLYECDLERIITSSQSLTDQHVQYFIYQVLRGLRYIHSARVLHRDLKPSNLLVNSNCDLAICDFGLARGVADTADTQLTEYVVTRWYRAPELLCESDRYGTPVDVWAVGCIMAEIICRRPFFRGGSTREQLEIIIAKLGTPSAEDQVGLSAHAVEIIARMGHRAPVPWTELLPEGTSVGAIDLLSRMLVFNQMKRITVEEALAHPYLHELHTRATEPLCERSFDWSFEREYPEEMPQRLLQAHMYGEMVALQRENHEIPPAGPVAIISREAYEASMAATAAAVAAGGAPAVAPFMGGGGAPVAAASGDTDATML